MKRNLNLNWRYATCFATLASGNTTVCFQTQVATFSTMIASIHLVEPHQESRNNNSLESNGKTFGNWTIRVDTCRGRTDTFVHFLGILWFSWSFSLGVLGAFLRGLGAFLGSLRAMLWTLGRVAGRLGWAADGRLGRDMHPSSNRCDGTWSLHANSFVDQLTIVMNIWCSDCLDEYQQKDVE